MHESLPRPGKRGKNWETSLASTRSGIDIARQIVDSPPPPDPLYRRPKMALQVNGQVIPDSAIEYELQRLVEFYATHMSPEAVEGKMEVLRERAREQAIGSKLLIDQSQKMDLEPSPEAIDQSYAAMVEKAGGPQPFRTALKHQNMTEAMVRQTVKRGKRVDMLIAKISEGTPDPTEDEIEAYFNEHAADYRRPERAHIHHILLQADASQSAARATAQSRLQELRQQLEDGADFAAMARSHSDCPSGKQSGGDLGWLRRDTTVPEFDAAVFALKIDELSVLPSGTERP